MKIITLTTLLLIIVSSFSNVRISAQDKQCALIVSQAPEAYGLRLGMTISQVKQAVPGLKIRPADEHGYTRSLWTIVAISNNSRPLFSDEEQETIINSAVLTQFRGLHRIEIHFLDDKIYAFAIIYETSKDIKTLDQIASLTSSRWKLPNNWQTVNNNGEEQRVLDCGDVRFAALFSSDGNPVSAMRDYIASRRLKAREMGLPEEQLLVTGQCDLKFEAVPEIRGFRLGMTAQDMLRRHPNLDLTEPDEDGHMVINYEGYYSASPIAEVLSEADRKNLDGFKLELLDSRLVLVSLTYDGKTEWANINEFINALATQLKLPNASQWAVVDQKTRKLMCDKFTIIVQVEPKYSAYERQRPSITIELTNLEAQLKERDRLRKEHEKQDFKP